MLLILVPLDIPFEQMARAEGCHILDLYHLLRHLLGPGLPPKLGDHVSRSISFRPWYWSQVGHYTDICCRVLTCQHQRSPGHDVAAMDGLCEAFFLQSRCMLIQG